MCIFWELGGGERQVSYQSLLRRDGISSVLKVKIIVITLLSFLAIFVL